MVQKIKNVLYITMRGVDLTQCTNLSFKIVQGDSFSKIYTPTAFTSLFFSLRNLETPVRVPPVPKAEMK